MSVPGFVLNISGRVCPSKDKTMETSEANGEGKDKSIKKLSLQWQLCFQVPKASYDSPDNCVVKGHLLYQKQILLTQAEMPLVHVLCFFFYFFSFV